MKRHHRINLAVITAALSRGWRIEHEPVTGAARLASPRGNAWLVRFSRTGTTAEPILPQKSAWLCRFCGPTDIDDDGPQIVCACCRRPYVRAAQMPAFAA